MGYNEDLIRRLTNNYYNIHLAYPSVKYLIANGVDGEYLRLKYGNNRKAMFVHSGVCSPMKGSMINSYRLFIIYEYNSGKVVDVCSAKDVIKYVAPNYKFSLMNVTRPESMLFLHNIGDKSYMIFSEGAFHVFRIARYSFEEYQLIMAQKNIKFTFGTKIYGRNLERYPKKIFYDMDLMGWDMYCTYLSIRCFDETWLYNYVKKNNWWDKLPKSWVWNIPDENGNLPITPENWRDTYYKYRTDFSEVKHDLSRYKKLNKR